VHRSRIARAVRRIAPECYADPMSWTVRAPFMIVAVAAVPAGIAVEVPGEASSWPGWVAVGAAVIALGWSAALWIRRRDDRAPLLPGLGAALLVLAMAGLGLLRGKTEDSTAPAQVAPTAGATPAQSSCWMGRATQDGAMFFATQLEADDLAAKKIGAMFERKFVTLVVTIDNRAGTSAVELDVTDAHFEPAAAGRDVVLPRDAVLDSSLGGREIAHKLHGGKYLVPAGGRLGDGLIFVDPARGLSGLTGLTVRANGKPLTLAGRTYSAQERQALSGPKRE
jgi:hypothetical protein